MKVAVLVSAERSKPDGAPSVVLVKWNGPVRPAGVVCFFATSWMKRRLKIDDSLDVTPVHGVGGVIGAAGLATAAFGGFDRVMAAYREAVALEYRFYSYGDAMLIA